MIPIPAWVRDLDTLLLFIEERHGTHDARRVHNIFTDELNRLVHRTVQCINNAKFFELTEPHRN